MTVPTVTPAGDVVPGGTSVRLATIIVNLVPHSVTGEPGYEIIISVPDYERGIEDMKQALEMVVRTLQRQGSFAFDE